MIESHLFLAFASQLIFGKRHKAKVLERMTYGKAMSMLHRAKKIRFDETGTQSDAYYHRHVPLIFIPEQRFP